MKNKVYLGDNHAEALQKQIRSYMGRVVTKEQLQKVLHSSNDLKKVEKSAKISRRRWKIKKRLQNVIRIYLS